MKIPVHEVKKIAVFRALQLGDMLCTIPAIRALRAAYPHAEITLLGLPWAKSLTDRFPGYIDRFIHFPGYPGLPEQELVPGNFTLFLAQVQQEKFDLVIQMQGNGSIINPMVVLLGAKYTAGFSIAGHFAPQNELFLSYPDHGHEINRHLTLMEFLGIKSQGTDLEFPLTVEDYNALDALNLNIAPKRYVCIHPGSRGAWRQWPVEYFASLADHCFELRYQVVITGTSDESDIVAQVIKNMQHTAINTAGLTSMGAVGALIKNAALLISNCTGVSHIASAYKTPSIVISMDGEPERWGPLDHVVHRTINWLAFPDYQVVFRELADLLKKVA